MELVRATNISKTFFPMDKPLLEDISFTVNSKESGTQPEHIALVGKNGSGKTTLLNIITGETKPDKGKLRLSTGKEVIAVLEQGGELNTSLSVIEEARNTIPLISKLELKMHRLEMQMEKDYTDRLLEEYAYLQDEYTKRDGYNFQSIVEATLTRFGFDKTIWDRKVSTLSGGEKTRLKIAKLFIKQPELIILDEPTNHLDIESIKWLENFLANYQGTFITVSHDREFLDKVSNKIFEIHNGKLKEYNGNYTDYIEQKRIEEERLAKQYEKQQKRIKQLEEELRRRSQWSFAKEKEKSGAYDKGRVGHLAAKLMKKAMNAKKNIERLLEKEKAEKPEKQKHINLTFDMDNTDSLLMMKTESLVKNIGGKPLLKNINLRIENGDKITIVGGNGTGKTTLLKILAGRLEQDSGNINSGSNTRIGYYSQELEELNESNKVLDELLSVRNDQSVIRLRLGTLGITGENVFKKISSLSYGEKSKVLLTKLLISEANMLIIDEPTNHLDIISKEAIEKSLIEYTGAFCLVTHDRYIANSVSDILYELKDGELIEHFNKRRDKNIQSI
jgi:ATP-binding cassette subfamily F protein 3